MGKICPNMEPLKDQQLLERLRRAIGDGGGVKAMSARTGIPVGTLNKYMAGTSMPSFDKAAKIAEAAGMSIAELAGEPPRQTQNQSMGGRAVLPAEALRVADEVLRRVYREEGVKLPADALMPETLRHTQSMIDRMDDPADAAEARALAPWLENRIRRELQAAAAAPGTGKREVS